MSIVPTVVISNTAQGAANGAYNGTDTTWYTDKYKGDGYYGYTDGLHTVSYKLTGFVGVITVQASIAASPTDVDWFNLDNTVGDGTTPLTSTGFLNFSGNFVWIRISITNFTAGTINRVIYN